MFFFGWGNSNKKWILDEDNSLVATWKYLHLFFCPIAFSITWHIIGDSRSEDRVLSYQQVKNMFTSKPPHIGAWNRFGLLIALTICIVFVLVVG